MDSSCIFIITCQYLQIAYYAINWITTGAQNSCSYANIAVVWLNKAVK